MQDVKKAFRLEDQRAFERFGLPLQVRGALCAEGVGLSRYCPEAAFD